MERKGERLKLNVTMTDGRKMRLGIFNGMVVPNMLNLSGYRCRHRTYHAIDGTIRVCRIGEPYRVPPMPRKGGSK
jgi:hypothetical protein